MADEIVYRLLAGEGITLTENSSTRTVEVAVPGLASKINIGDIGQATTVNAGLIELLTVAEAQGLTDSERAMTAAALAGLLQAGMYSATANRLLIPGSFGLGAEVVPDTVDINGITRGGLYRFQNNAQGPSLAAHVLLHLPFTTGGYAVQVAARYAGDNIYWRRQSAGTWQPWRELWHDANFDPDTKANISGTYPSLNVGNAATVGNQTDAQLAPPGAMVLFARNSAPSGWLKANGAAVSRTTYSALFAAIGTIWGAGNGSTTFNLPDWRGEFGRGWDDGRGLDSGRAFASVQAGQNQLHGHTTTGAGAHTHQMSTAAQYSTFDDPPNATVSYLGGDSNASNLYGGNSTLANGDYITSAGNHTHPISLEGGEARPRNVAGLWCIKF